jgi:hypothetical protein
MTVHGYPADAIIAFMRKTPDAAVSVHIRMDIDKHAMPEHQTRGAPVRVSRLWCNERDVLADNSE